MVNISDSLLKHLINIEIKQGLNPSDFIITFIIDKTKQQDSIKIMFIPIFDYEDKNANIPFTSYFLIKRLGVWLACDADFFFYGSIRKFCLDKNKNICTKIVPSVGKNSFIYFLGRCLVEHMQKEKLTKKELCNNIKISSYKLNKIINGTYDYITIKDLSDISIEIQGINKKRTYKVLVEKYVDNLKEK
jgi:hypothetical protein